MKQTKNIPLGVQIISILHFIGAGMNAIGALLSLWIAMLVMNISETPAELDMPMLFGPFLGAVIIVFAVIALAMGVLQFFVGLGLWKAQKWARITAIVLSGLGVVFGILSMLPSEMQGVTIESIVFGLLISGVSAWIVLYLLQNKEVQHVFK